MEHKRTVIEAEHVCRSYNTIKRGNDWLKTLFKREYTSISAVKDVNFKIKEGEIVGFLGPNGAGKSTVIKLLCGVLTPTVGSVLVLGYDPFKYRKKNAFEIGAVFGQRSQLWWDLPIGDTFCLLKKIYKISNETYQKNLDLYHAYLDLNLIWTQPVRQLSLGQRMKAEIAAAILHDPRVLFLDEPTIGLDAVAKRQIRKFIDYINKHINTTIILTSHDTKDIEVLCERIIVIDKGSIILDSDMNQLQKRYEVENYLKVRFNNRITEPISSKLAKAKCVDNGYTWDICFNNDQQSYSSIIGDLLVHGELSDITVIQKSIEDMIIDIYENGISG